MYIKHEESHGETGQIGYPCMDATDYYHIGLYLFFNGH